MKKLPVLWVLTGSKAGDNAQILRAARAAGLSYEVKRIAIRHGCEGRKPWVRPSLRYVDALRSDKLGPPWPEAVLTIGRHLSLVALWIKKQSSGRTKVVLFNAPKGRDAAFDLVVLPPYYRSNGLPNVLEIRMPLIGIEPARIEVAREAFRASLAHMPRPLHVLLVGGDMGQRKLNPYFADSILREMQLGFAARGSIQVATSRRTPAAVTETLCRNLRPQDRLYAWGTEGVENPYLGLLAHGDTFTVTADSLSMVIEVARLGKPLVIAEPQPRQGALGQFDRLRDLFRSRDLRKALAMLYGSGHATRLGEEIRTPAGALPDETERVASNLRRLVEGTG